MDLKTWMFCRRMQPTTLARIIGVSPDLARRLIERKTRPRGDVAYRIEYLTRKQVTVHELIHPNEYPVIWDGDTACKRKYKRANPPVAINEEIRQQINERFKLFKKKKKVCVGVQSPWMEEKIAGQQNKGSDSI